MTFGLHGLRGQELLDEQERLVGLYTYLIDAWEADRIKAARDGNRKRERECAFERDCCEKDLGTIRWMMERQTAVS